MSTLYVNTITPNSGDTVSVSGSLFVSGTINLGDANTDSISFGADVSSSILPDANNVYDLGSSTKSWRNVFGTASLATQSISSSNANTASFLLANRAASSQTSITTVGTLAGLNVSGNVVITGSNLTLGAAQIIGSASTASFGRITAASQVTASAFTGSFTGSLFGVASSATTASLAISASFIEASNVNGTVVSASYTSASTSASHALTAVTASHVAAAGVAGTVTSASQATRVTFTNTTSSFNALTATQVTASSATGSFIGLLTGQITASSATGSFTGSLSGDATTASFATTAVTASYAVSASALQSNGSGDINIITSNNISLTANDDISITTSTADGLITLHSAHTTGQAILIDANAAAGSILDVDAGIIDVDVQGLVTIDSVGLSIDSAGVAANITSTTDGAAEDFTIALAGATDSSLILSSTGTGADALQITTTAGGIDISATGNAAGEDIDISSAASVNVTATEDVANAIYLRANGGTSETIKIHSDQGTGAGSVEITSDAGSIDINSGDNITVDAADDITVTADNVSMVANVTAAKIQSPTTAVTATDAGAAIPAGTAVALVNADSDANHIVILPAPVVGNIIHIIENGTTGYELRTSTPASIGINGGTASNGESAIAGAITYVRCVCVSSTSWIATQFDADGDESKVEAAA